MPAAVQNALESTPPGAATVPGAALSLAEAFVAVCRRFPDRVAVTAGQEQITYRELDRAASNVAAALLERAQTADSIVAIYMERSINMVAAMLGVIKAGAAYLPIDPTYPEARVLETLADAQPVAVLADAAHIEALQHRAVGVLDAELLVATPAAPTAPDTTSAEQLAYVIYTSGSTGRPKGVMVTHQNVLRLFEETDHWFHFDERDVWTMFHSFAFDFSVWEIWGPLLTGGRLVIVPFSVSRSPEDFLALLAQEQVTVLNQTPTAFSMLIHADLSGAVKLPALRLVILGGEALNLRTLLPWFQRHGDSRPQMINMYGITETTVHVTYRRILEQDAARENDSIIGEPIPDLTLHLLDDALQPVADGATGEICISGPAVARGYLGRAELTAERFITDPHDPAAGRMYRSGDLARRRADGELVYLGRADRQVKINGFRIELGEIEAVLTTHPGVAQVCVTTWEDAAAGPRLAAYVVSSSEGFDAEVLRQHAEEHLPAQMRPAFYVPMQALPLNVNGKVDRTALPTPIAAVSAGSVAASSGLEERIAATWLRVLQRDHVSVEENFFDAGGTSLLLVSLRGELQKELARTIPVTWLFEHTTVRSLAAKLGTAESAPAAAAPALGSNAEQQRKFFARMRALRSNTR